MRDQTVFIDRRSEALHKRMRAFYELRIPRARRLIAGRIGMVHLRTPS